jgi:hypothetical protein
VDTEPKRAAAISAAAKPMPIDFVLIILNMAKLKWLIVDNLLLLSGSFDFEFTTEYKDPDGYFELDNSKNKPKPPPEDGGPATTTAVDITKASVEADNSSTSDDKNNIAKEEATNILVMTKSIVNHNKSKRIL